MKCWGAVERKTGKVIEVAIEKGTIEYLTQKAIMATELEKSLSAAELGINADDIFELVEFELVRVK